LNVFDLIWQASKLVQIVIAVLAAASVLSWAAIAFKWRELGGAARASEAFLAVYHQGSFEDAEKAAKGNGKSPLARVLLASVGELKKIARYRGRQSEDGLDPNQLRTVHKAIQWAAAEEILRLEARLPLLATVGSAAPFVGLFGTVIGIVNAFTGIGASGNASLAVVAPGIAEALVTTAIGLFAAIPATVFYNVFVAKLRDLTAALDLFAAELQDDIAHLASAGRAAGPRAVER
jgi:biopolymer transport protein TolQ